MIAFVGSVFSPWYFRSRRRGRGNPLDHCALNVVLIGPRTKRWAMTERGRQSVAREASSFAIGPSSLRFDNGCLRVAIQEVASPLPHRIAGEVRVYPLVTTCTDFPLDPDGWHRWWPISPSCLVEVEMRQPAMRWSGNGYLDTNWGGRALETDFSRWDWSCARIDEGAAILYETWRRDGGSECLALSVDRRGHVERFAAPPPIRLPDTAWRLKRATRAESVGTVKTLDDTPFYARSIVGSCLLGRNVTAVHESLSLDRFRTPWMQAMLPFRMRRW